MAKPNREKSTLYLWIRSLTIALSMFMAGYCLGVINTIGERLVLNFQWTEKQESTNLSLVASLSSLSIIFGPLVAIKLRTFGQIRILLFTNVISTVGLILTIITNFPMLLIGRILIGMAMGLSFAYSASFIAETSPLEKQGITGALAGLSLTTGIMISYLFGLNNTAILDMNNNFDWRVAAAFPILTNIVQLSLLPLVVVESPRYLVLSKEDHTHAVTSLKSLYKDLHVEPELAVLIKEKKLQQKEQFWYLVRRFRRPLIMAISLACIQQFSGIAPVNFYSNKLFQISGLSSEMARVYTVYMGLANIAGSITCVILAHFISTKKLEIAGLIGVMGILCGFATSLLTEAYIACRALLIIYCFVYSATIGSVTYMIVPQLVPAMLSNVPFIFNGLASFLVGFTFLYLKESSFGASGAFFLYAGACLLSLIHCLYDLAETKNKTFDEIMRFYIKDVKEKDYEGGTFIMDAGHLGLAAKAASRYSALPAIIQKLEEPPKAPLAAEMVELETDRDPTLLTPGSTTSAFQNRHHSRTPSAMSQVSDAPFSIQGEAVNE
jgi:SP family sugar:H+ symporter-like MFS transporter